MAAHPKGYCPVFGNYPKEYNRAVHGPFYPWVDYRSGPKDIPFKDVKLGDLKAWIGRRDKTPQAITSAFSRNVHLYSYKWIETRFGSFSKPLFHVIILSCTYSMLSLYGYLKLHRNHKYHW